MAKISAMEQRRKKSRKSPEQFYAAPRDPPGESALPIFDKKHVQNAMARFNQTNFESKAEKSKAYRKILRLALKFGINVDNFKKLKP